MAKNLIRAMPWSWVRAWAAVVRSLCTAPASTDAVVEWRPLYRRLSALGGSPNESVAAALDQWLAEGRKVTVPQLMRHVRQLRKYGRNSHALEMMNWMERQGMKMSNGCYAVHIDLVSKVKGIDSAEEYFSMLREPVKQHKTFGALFNCYCASGMAEKAIALFKKMKELDFTSNALVYNNLMNLHLKLGQPEIVTNLFQEMKANNVVPDNWTFRILMKSFALVNDMVSVERSVQELEGTLGAADWLTYCHLAAIYNSAGHFEKAKTTVMKAELVMDGHDLSPFPLLINLYAGAGQLAEVKRIWKMLTARVARPTNKSFLAMFRALKKLDDLDSFEEWESVCLNYDTRLMNVVIEANLEKGMMEEAALLLEKAAARVVRADLQSFALVISYCLKSNEREAAQKYSRAATTMVKMGRMGAVEKDDDQFEDVKDAGTREDCEEDETCN